MPPLSLVRDYFVWHYSIAYADIMNIWWNYIWFVNHLFAVPQVITHMFSPFKRLQEDKVSFIKDPGAYFGNMLVNMIMRVVGFFIRAAIICIAIIGFSFVFLIGAATLVIWTILPALIFFWLTSGIHLLFS